MSNTYVHGSVLFIESCGLFTQLIHKERINNHERIFVTQPSHRLSKVLIREAEKNEYGEYDLDSLCKCWRECKAYDLNTGDRERVIDFYDTIYYFDDILLGQPVIQICPNQLIEKSIVYSDYVVEKHLHHRRFQSMVHAGEAPPLLKKIIELEKKSSLLWRIYSSIVNIYHLDYYQRIINWVDENPFQ